MINRDTEAEIVIGMPIWFRVIAWLGLLIFVAMFIVGLVGILADDGSLGYVMTVIGFLLIPQGIGMVGMATKLTFNKPNGFMTVTSGHVPFFLWLKRTRIISKEEANRAFVAFRDTPTLIGQIGTLLLALMLLLPVYRPTTRSYEVKIVRASGKEVKLIESRKAELADYLAKRIAGFGEGISSDKISIEERASKVQKARM